MPMPGASGEPYVWAVLALILFSVLVGLGIALAKVARSHRSGRREDSSTLRFSDRERDTHTNPTDLGKSK